MPAGSLPDRRRVLPIPVSLWKNLRHGAIVQRGEEILDSSKTPSDAFQWRRRGAWPRVVRLGRAEARARVAHRGSYQNRGPERHRDTAVEAASLVTADRISEHRHGARGGAGAETGEGRRRDLHVRP